MTRVGAYLREVLFILGDDRRRLPALGGAIVMSAALDTVGIGLIGPFVALAMNPGVLESTAAGRWVCSIVGSSSPARVITVCGIALALVFWMKTAAALWTQRVLARFSERQQVRLRSELVARYQRMPYEAHLQRNSAELLEIVTAHVNMYCGPCLLVLLRVAAEAVVVTALLAVLAYTHWVSVAMLLAVLALVGLLYDRLFRSRIRGIGRTLSDANVRMVRGIRHAFEGIKEIRVLGTDAHFRAEVDAGSRHHARANADLQVIQMMPRYLTETAVLTFVILVVLVAQSRGEGVETVGPVLAMFGVAGLRILPSTNLLLGGLNQLRSTRYAVGTLYDALSSLPEVGELPREARRPPAAERLDSFELRGARYRYPNASEWALEDVRFALKRGESIGLVGPSGSGKTTLVDVVLGLLRPQEGEVLFNGRPLETCPRAWLDQVAYLPQLVFLIDDSLRANVALGVPPGEIDDARVLDSLRQAQLGDLVARLPEGLDTAVGERGVRLSGGQRQRVALARAFYHGRDVLVMDEATSALDDETERQVVEQVERLAGSKTMIVIAHRMTTVGRCDRIYRVEDGRVTEVPASAQAARSGPRRV